MKLNTCFENFGVSDVFSQIPYAIKAAKRNLDIHRIYHFDNGKLTIRKNSRAFNLYAKRSDNMFDMRENCANSFEKMFISLYAYVLFMEDKDQLENYSKLFRLYKKEALKAFKELETFREFKFDSALKKEIFSLEFGEIKTGDKMDELITKFYGEIFNQE